MSSKLRIGIGKKRNVAVYGLQRFPVTLYADQWQALLDKAPEILAFIDRHADELEMRESEDVDSEPL